MSRVAILSFSARGAETADRIENALPDCCCEKYAPKGNLKSLTAQLFYVTDALIFVGACGIAVRAIAPNLVSKTTDPAVIVVDERANFAISLLSGHIGGANELTVKIASSIGAVPVITTATDVNNRFSADAWASRNSLFIDNMDLAKRFSAEILKRDLPFYSDFPINGSLPSGLYAGSGGDCGLVISCANIRPFENTLLLIPKILHIGIGCRRGINADAVGDAVTRALEGAGLSRNAVAAVSSIDVKRDETGLIEWASNNNIPLFFYTADELNALRGDFTASEFVKQTVGVDNVCERAAVCSAGDGAQLIINKTSYNGVTVAIAQEKWRVPFE